jgi:glutathione S-transferase
MHFYPLVAIVTLLALLVYFYMGLQVGQGRSKFGVAAPATTGNPDFERLFRVQMNTLEWLPLFLVSLWLFAVAWNDDRITAAIGLVWIVGRVLYLTGYSKAAASRSLGFLVQALATGILLFGALGRLVWIAVQFGV